MKATHGLQSEESVWPDSISPDPLESGTGDSKRAALKKAIES